MKPRRLAAVPVSTLDALEEFEQRRSELVSSLTTEREELRNRLDRVERALQSVGALPLGRPSGWGRPRNSGATGKTIQYLQDNPGKTAAELAKVSGVPASVVSRLFTQGRVTRRQENGLWVYYPAGSPYPSEDPK